MPRGRSASNPPALGRRSARLAAQSPKARGPVTPAAAGGKLWPQMAEPVVTASSSTHPTPQGEAGQLTAFLTRLEEKFDGLASRVKDMEQVQLEGQGPGRLRPFATGTSAGEQVPSSTQMAEFAAAVSKIAPPPKGLRDPVQPVGEHDPETFAMTPGDKTRSAPEEPQKTEETLRAVCALLAQSARKAETREWMTDEDDSVRLPGARGAAMMENMRRSFENEPGKWANSFKKRVERDLGAEGGTRPYTMFDYVDKTSWATYRTAARAAYGYAAIWQALQDADRTCPHVQRALALSGALIGACEQSVTDGGTWDLAWQLTTLPEPRLGGTDKKPPRGAVARCVDPGAIAAAVAYLKDMKVLEDRRKGVAKGSNED
jgi:hypothetical protein